MTAIKRDTSRKRNEILDAAAQAFRDVGYESASMDRIAEIAGASKRTVYNHFASKDLLFQEVIDRMMGEIVKLKRIPYDPARSLEDQLSDFAETKLAVARNPSWLGLMKVALGVFISNPELAEETIAKAESGGDDLVTWLRAAAEDGRVKVDQFEIAANVFWSMVGGAFFWPSIIQGPMDTAKAGTLKQEMVLTFLSRYRS
jgi:TetR/AcrR family transcriptional regulator of autoinduction and epiphytic fitness